MSGEALNKAVSKLRSKPTRDNAKVFIQLAKTCLSSVPDCAATIEGHVKACLRDASCIENRWISAQLQTVLGCVLLMQNRVAECATLFQSSLKQASFASHRVLHSICTKKTVVIDTKFPSCHAEYVEYLVSGLNAIMTGKATASETIESLQVASDCGDYDVSLHARLLWVYCLRHRMQHSDWDDAIRLVEISFKRLRTASLDNYTRTVLSTLFLNELSYLHRIEPLPGDEADTVHIDNLVSDSAEPLGELEKPHVRFPLTSVEERDMLLFSATRSKLCESLVQSGQTDKAVVEVRNGSNKPDSGSPCGQELAPSAKRDESNPSNLNIVQHGVLLSGNSSQPCWQYCVQLEMEQYLDVLSTAKHALSTKSMQLHESLCIELYAGEACYRLGRWSDAEQYLRTALAKVKNDHNVINAQIRNNLACVQLAKTGASFVSNSKVRVESCRMLERAMALLKTQERGQGYRVRQKVASNLTQLLFDLKDDYAACVNWLQFRGLGVSCKLQEYRALLTSNVSLDVRVATRWLELYKGSVDLMSVKKRCIALDHAS